MFVKTHILGCYQGIYQVGGYAFKFNRRAVFFIISAYQFAIGIINLG